MTVSGTGFGTKSQAAPLVWDVTSAQYVNGTNQNAYSGLSDGSSIPDTIWNPGVDVRYTTSRSHRDSFVTAHYAGHYLSPDNEVASCKVWLAAHTPPSTQKRFYASFYRKLKCSADEVGDGSTKIMRFGSLTDPINNIVAALGNGIRNSAGDHVAWIGCGGETTWVRWELYADATKQWCDVWKNGHYHLGSYSGAGGTVEFRPAADWQFRTPGVSGYQFDAPWLQSDEGVFPSQMGHDDGHGVSLSQEVDLSEIYYDNTQARVEISDQSTWDDSPSSTAHREVQGRLTSWSGTQVQLVVFQGGFSSLSGKYVYVIDADGNASNGYQLP